VSILELEDYEQREEHTYKPRSQFVDFHKRWQRWAVMVAHRRAGKTVACVNDLILAAVGNLPAYQRAIFDEKPHKLHFAYIAPLYKQAKAVAWEYTKEYGLQWHGAEASESELRVNFPPTEQAPKGGEVRLYGADNPDALRGIYLDGVILDEAADMSPRVNEVIRPTLSDYQGWCVWIGTPRGQNDFYDLVYGTSQRPGAKDNPNWFFKVLRASETGILRSEELDSARGHMTPEQFQQEYECSFQAAILGAYYGRELELAEKEGRIGGSCYDPNLPVNTAWDLGHSDATAIWFYQTDGFNIRLIDFYQASNESLDHYIVLLRDKAAVPGKTKGYKYDKHYLPHDVQHKIIGMDKTRIQQLRQHLQSVVVVPKVEVDDGINAVRSILPKCYFDAIKCQDGLKALKQYRREYDDRRKTFVERPYHDWASDPADAFRYLAIGLRRPAPPKAEKRRRDQPKKSWIY